MADTRKRIPLWSILTAGVLAVAFGYLVFHYVTVTQRHAATTDVPVIGGQFELVDHHGRSVSADDFDGRFMLIYFGYTYCPGNCPSALTAMADALDLLGAAGNKIVPIFITVDPARDTPEQLRMYVDFFHPRLVGMTGTSEQIAAVAKAYQIFYAKSDTRRADAEDYLMDHTPIIYLMGPEGRYRTHFTPQTAPDIIAASIREVL